MGIRSLHNKHYDKIIGPTWKNAISYHLKKCQASQIKAEEKMWTLSETENLTSTTVTDDKIEEYWQTIVKLASFYEEKQEIFLKQRNRFENRLALLNQLISLHSSEILPKETKEAIQLLNDSKHLLYIEPSRIRSKKEFALEIELTHSTHFDELCSEPEKFNIWKERINETIATFEPSFQNILDYEIYQTSTDPNKGGEAWGKIHRFDDLPLFKTAFLTICERWRNHFVEETHALLTLKERLDKIVTPADFVQNKEALKKAIETLPAHLPQAFYQQLLIKSDHPDNLLEPEEEAKKHCVDSKQLISTVVDALIQEHCALSEPGN